MDSAERLENHDCGIGYYSSAGRRVQEFQLRGTGRLDDVGRSHAPGHPGSGIEISLICGGASSPSSNGRRTILDVNARVTIIGYGLTAALREGTI